VTRVVLGRALVISGIVAGLLAVGIPFAGGSRYVDDGTTAAFLIVLLSLTSWLPAEIGRDRLSAVAGAAAFGFFLFVPAVFAFDSFGQMEAGAWLGVCTVLIPIGALLVAEGEESAIDRGPGLLVGTVGLVLLVVGIWLDVGSDGPTYWNLSSSGHAAGLLLIALVAASALLIGAAAHSRRRLGYPAALVASATFGFSEVALVSAAFGAFGSLGAGAWIEACGGFLLLGGIVLPQLAGSSTPAPTPAHAG
jgi:hypothetical protein